MKVTLELRKLDEVPQGFFRNPKTKLGDVVARIAVDPTSISHLVEVRDDFGTPYTQAWLESDSSLIYTSYAYEDDTYETYYLALAGTLELNNSILGGALDEKGNFV